MREATCSRCRFWRKGVRAKWQDFTDRGQTVQVDHAQCRRYAPASRKAARDEAYAGAVWPEVNATDWCGDFAPRDGKEGG